MSTSAPRRKIVIFDVEGVLLPKNRYLAFEVGRFISFPQFIKFLFFGILYEIGILSLESALKRIFKLFQNFSIEELLDIFRKMSLLPHVEATFIKLREKGLKTALISSGLPQVIVESLATRLKADYAFGLELETNKSILTGNIKGDVIRKNGKALVMKKIFNKANISKKDCVIVADDRNNTSIFYPEALKIGYNPDFMIVRKADYIIKKNLLELVSILEKAPVHMQEPLLQNEVVRETIHASGFFVIVIAIRLGIYQAVFVLSLITLIYTASELARMENRSIPIVSSITLKAATFSERYEFTTAPIFLALGITLSLLLFPTPINYASIAIVSFGDSAASIFGKLFGRTPVPFNKGKSLEGSVVGLAFAFLGAAIFLHPLQAFVGAIVAILMESLPLPISDNISTPLTTGALLTLLF
ncbi:MAG: HAD-IB family phosphatase [Candidatus Bathyarchaeota archaeon]|nr:MAG: HAD-IB family phosphatase [Candidatus Bathyarchaeota archaeon]